MGYSEKNEGNLEDTELENSIDNSLEDSTDKVVKNDSEVKNKKSTKSTSSKANSKEKTSFFKGVQSEFKKIIWPSGEDLGKQSVAVVTMSVLLGLLIAVVDLIVKFGLEHIV